MFVLFNGVMSENLEKPGEQLGEQEVRSESNAAQVLISDEIRKALANCHFMGAPEVSGNTIKIPLKGKILDDSDIRKLGVLLNLAKGNPGITIALEQTELRYLSSAALGKFITLRRVLDQSNGRLVMRNVPDKDPDDTMAVYRIARLDDYFVFEKDENDRKDK